MACAIRRAIAVYVSALDGENPRLRKLAESALLAIKDQAHTEIAAAAQSARLGKAAALSLDRVLATLTPLIHWRVIGPFPRNTPQLLSRAGAAGFHEELHRLRTASPSRGSTAAATAAPAGSTWLISSRPQARMSPAMTPQPASLSLDMPK